MATTVIVKRTITVRAQWTGWHQWAQAPPDRNYLALEHRHRFMVAATLPVSHNDRQLEFHDVQDHLEVLVLNYHKIVVNHACEHFAEGLARLLLLKYQTPWVEVTVSEDGENDATVRVEAVV